MMERIVMFGEAEMRLVGVHLLHAEESDSDGFPASRAVAERAIFVDISMGAGDRRFLSRASALPLVSSILVLLSEIGIVREVNFAVGDGEFNIRGLLLNGFFELVLEADSYLAQWNCTRDQLALFLCNLASGIDSILRVKGITLDGLLEKFPVIG